MGRKMCKKKKISTTKVLIFFSKKKKKKRKIFDIMNDASVNWLTKKNCLLTISREKYTI